MILFHHRGTSLQMVAATESHRILALFRGTLFCMSYAAIWKETGPPGYRTLFCRLKAGGITLMLATRYKNDPLVGIAPTYTSLRNRPCSC